MRVYTEVNFQWNDKKGKLVEVSSDSFDYSGEMALCVEETGDLVTGYPREPGKKYVPPGSEEVEPEEVVEEEVVEEEVAPILDAEGRERYHGVKGWEYWKTTWFDDQGYEYRTEVRLNKKRTKVRRQRYERRKPGGGWEYFGGTQEKDMKKSEAHKRFKRRVAKESDRSGTAHEDKGTWQSWWGEEFGGEQPTDDLAKNQDYLDNKERYTQEGGEQLSQAEYNALTDEQKKMYTEDKGEDGAGLGTYTEVRSDLYVPGGDTKKKEVRYAEEALELEIAKWKRLTGIEETDEFQRELILDVQGIRDAEGLVTSAFEEYEKMIGRAEEEYITDVEEETGEEGELTLLARDLEEGYTTSYERLMGKTFTDPSTGEEVDANVALERGIITQEEYDEFAGTYRLDVREQEKIREEGLESAVTGREESLESLRKESFQKIRAAEAEIGAAGFATSGVGRTARDVLAEEMRGEARDIGEAFSEERSDVKEGYITEIGDIERGKGEDLEDYLDIKTKGLEKIRIQKEEALEGFLETRTEAGEDIGITSGWKAASEAYESLLAGFGIGEGLDISPYEDVTARAEEALGTIQANILDLVDLHQKVEGMEDWDPFTIEGGYSDIGRTMGLTAGGELDPDAVKGLFDPTITEYEYKPTEGLKLYDPEYTLPWEEAGYTLPWED